MVAASEVPTLVPVLPPADSISVISSPQDENTGETATPFLQSEQPKHKPDDDKLVPAQASGKEPEVNLRSPGMLKLYAAWAVCYCNPFMAGYEEPSLPRLGVIDYQIRPDLFDSRQVSAARRHSGVSPEALCLPSRRSVSSL